MCWERPSMKTLHLPPNFSVNLNQPWKIVFENLITFLIADLYCMLFSFSRLWITVEYFFALVFPVGPTSKEPACQFRGHNKTQVQYLGGEYPLKEEMTSHSNILSWRIPWTEGPGGLQSTGLQRVGHDWATSLHFTSPKSTQASSAYLAAVLCLAFL